MNSKMAAHKPEILIFQPEYNCYMQPAKFQWQLIFPRWINSMRLFPILCKASRSQKSKMAAHKHGKLICQFEYNVAGQFQRLQTFIFGLKNFATRFLILCNASERTYISACIQYSCAIPTTIPMFQGLEMQRNYSSLCVMEAVCRTQAAILDF